MQQVIIKVIAIIFIISAVAVIIAGTIGYLSCSTNYVGIASALGTLAGAILVFSTLEMQRESLYEEIHRNEIERFDSRFYPILSSFRTDASNMEITGEYISSKGIGAISSYKGERAFTAARSIVNGLNGYLCNNSFERYDEEEFEDVLRKFHDISDALYEDFPCQEDLDKVEKERKEYIKSKQILFLADKWGITKNDKMDYMQMDRKARDSFLLNLLMNHQSATFSKYIQSLRFIFQIISTLRPGTERAKYYHHVSCLIGKEELLFLSCFIEFNKITDNRNVYFQGSNYVKLK